MISIKWPDGHVTDLSSDWLYERRFCEETQKKRLATIDVDYETWGSDFKQRIPRSDFEKVCSLSLSLCFPKDTFTRELLIKCSRKD